MTNFVEKVMQYLKDRECSMTIEMIDGCWRVSIYDNDGNNICGYRNTDLEKAVSLSMDELYRHENMDKIIQLEQLNAKRKR